MALNCCMLTPRQPPTPVPLPGEKAFISIPGVQVDLQGLSSPSSSTTTTTTSVSAGSRVHSAKGGTVYLTSKRVIFVAHNAARLPPIQPRPDSDSNTNADDQLAEIRSLSINLSNFRNGRFVQPWFSANYYDAVVVPQQGGGLKGPYSIKMYFNEGRAFEFHQTLQEVKARYDAQRRPQDEEPLPLYDPQASTEPGDLQAGPSSVPTETSIRSAPNETGSGRPQLAIQPDGPPPAYDDPN